MGNATAISSDVGAINFTPNHAANAAFLALYCILLVLHCLICVLNPKYYGYSIGMIGGILLEVIGYAGKVQLSQNTASKNAYIMYIIGLTLGPTFLSSALYLGVSALQQRYPSAQFKHIGPRTFSTLFILGDFICLCFIGCGGSLAAIYSTNPIGVDLMIAGLGVQVLFTTIFCIILLVIYRRAWELICLEKKKFFLKGSVIAAACLLVRSCWRAAELSGGFNGPLTSMETVFFLLDSIPMMAMTILLTCLHSGYWLKDDKISFKGFMGL